MSLARKIAGKCIARAGMLVIIFYLGLASADAVTIKVGGTGGALGTMRVLAESFKKTNPTVDVAIVSGLGSGGGRRALQAGALDVALTSRPGSKGPKLKTVTARLYGRSPFVFAVPAKNKITNVTKQDIIEIFNGKKTHWASGKPVRLILRPLVDSDSELLMGIGPDMERAIRSAHKRKGMSVAVDDGESATMIESSPGAFGTSLYCLILSEKRALKALSVNGIQPNPRSIAEGSYPWFKSFYILTRKDASEPARLFAEYVLSVRGQQLISNLGHWLPEVRAGR